MRNWGLGAMSGSLDAMASPTSTSCLEPSLHSSGFPIAVLHVPTLDDLDQECSISFQF
jgi:hypothetical protein